MASQGPLSPSTLVDDPTGNYAWANPGNAAVSDDVYSTAVVGAIDSNALKATNFGFSIPSGAFISGIVAEVEAKASSANTSTLYVYAIDTLGDYTSNRSTTIGTADAYYPFGNSTDLWGTTWTVNHINSSSFGVGVTAVNTNNTISIDHIRVTVYYSSSPFPVFLYS